MTTRRATMLVMLAALLALGGCPRKKGDRGKRSVKLAKTEAEKEAKAVAEAKAAVKKGALGVAAEKQPHPDFPTPRLAKTEKIFLLEEPDRGPWVKTAKVPEAPKGKWTTYFFCQVTPDTVACGRKGGGGVRAHWRVLRGKKLVVAEERFGPRVMSTYVLHRIKGKALSQMIALDRHGQVLWSRHYRGAGSDYSSRNRDGSNALTGCGFLKLERDKKGRVEHVGCLQWAGQPMRDENGVVYTRHRRDRAGFSVATWRLDKDRKPINGQDGVHRTKNRRDAAGRVTERRYYDKERFPTLSSRDGCYGWRLKYDGRGLLERKTCLGTVGRAIQDASGVCAYTFSYDGRGCKVSVVDLQLSGKECSKRFKRYAYNVNAACEIMTQVCYGATDKRKACGIRQPAEYRYTRDTLGRITSQKHFGVNHKPGKDLECTSFELRMWYDKQGNVIKRTYHDPSGVPKNCSGAGYHGITHVRDEAGRTKETRFIDRRGNAGTNLGCAVRRFQYDNYDHQVKTVNYGFDGKIKDVRGMGSMRIIYDQGHRQFGILLYDIQDRPARYRACFTSRTCPRKKTWHAMRIQRRANGSVSKNLFFDHEGQLVATISCDKKPCWR